MGGVSGIVNAIPISTYDSILVILVLTLFPQIYALFCPKQCPVQRDIVQIRTLPPLGFWTFWLKIGRLQCWNRRLKKIVQIYFCFMISSFLISYFPLSVFLAINYFSPGNIYLPFLKILLETSSPGSKESQVNH